MAATERQQVVQEQKIQAIYDSYMTIEVRLAAIEVHLAYIREKLD